MDRISNPNLNVVMEYAYLVIRSSTDTDQSLDVAFWLQDYYEDVLECWIKPQKVTAIHKYIEYIIDFFIGYALDKHFPIPEIKSMTSILDNYDIDYSKIGELDISEFGDSDSTEELEEYANQLFQFFIESAFDRFVNDVFNTLFWNKNFLYEFNLQSARFICELNEENYSDLLKEEGVLKRTKYVPSWLKNAIIYRDKNRCSLCGCDLSKSHTTVTKENYDHIIPLQNGGNNDPSNWQLTCEQCNKSKGHRSSNFTNIVMPFWER
ncbi:HNH endonuclease [Streptococcus agalactiae]|uniref:HNH endonuclease n=1 Tax=Streptococcus agalactiae TaxID=1311 RepID=A0A8B4RA92_STRAG|nr:HNH endonuclease signature motif containing protein [Streptococcus agalactiae]SUN11966.1 HNH endonuclease [Streptococcus agalactiae]